MAAKPQPSSFEHIRALHAELRATLRHTLERTRSLHAASAITRREAAEACARSRRLLAEAEERAKRKALL